MKQNCMVKLCDCDVLYIGCLFGELGGYDRDPFVRMHILAAYTGNTFFCCNSCRS
mgnify:CR=1 FL=1